LAESTTGKLKKSRIDLQDNLAAPARQAGGKTAGGAAPPAASVSRSLGPAGNPAGGQGG
jgi:hypothetical protein